jgi:hypothetical protein
VWMAGGCLCPVSVMTRTSGFMRVQSSAKLNDGTPLIEVCNSAPKYDMHVVQPSVRGGCGTKHAVGLTRGGERFYS